MEHRSIKIVAVKGSVRPGNYTGMALSLVLDEFTKHPGEQVEVIDPAKLDMNLPGVDEGKDDPKMIKEIVQDATGVVIATPEYHGSFSSQIKLVIENYPDDPRGRAHRSRDRQAGRWSFRPVRILRPKEPPFVPRPGGCGSG